MPRALGALSSSDFKHIIGARKPTQQLQNWYRNFNNSSWWKKGKRKQLRIVSIGMCSLPRRTSRFLGCLSTQVESLLPVRNAASQNEFSASREEIQSIFDNPILSWLLSTDTPTKHISAELVTIWLVPGSEHLASKFFWFGQRVRVRGAS